jgi:hypothetical protein
MSNFLMASPRVLLAATLCVLTTGACSPGSEGSGKVSLTLQVAPRLDEATERIRTARELGALAAQTASRSFTPTSFKLPIFKITIANDDGTEEQNLYTCEEATAEGCLVDLMDQAALDALAAAAADASIRAGTYERISLNTCVDGTSGTDRTIARITGSGVGPSGVRWRTDAGDLVAIDSAAAEETDVGNWACSTKNVLVKGGVTVGD